MDRAEQLVVLANSSRFRASAPFQLCDLDRMVVLIIDAGCARRTSSC